MKTKHVKDLLIYILFCVIIAISQYSVPIKIFFFCISIILFCLGVIRPVSKHICVFLGLFTGCFFAVTLILNFRVYYPFLGQMGSTWNKQSGGYGAQLAYTYNTGHSDSILPTIIQNKTVYTNTDNPMSQLLSCFAKEVVYLDSLEEEKIDFEDARSRYIDIGRHSLNEAGVLFSDKRIEEEYYLAKEALGGDPHIYISSINAIDDAGIVFLMDEFYNVYLVAR